MMKNLHVTLLILICMGVTSVAFAQEQSIARNEYYTLYRTALDRTGDVSRHVTESQILYDKGTITRTQESTYDYENKDTLKYIWTESSANKISKMESVQIGKAFYCKKDLEEWKKSENYCSVSPFRTIPVPDEATYFLEKASDGEVYRSYITFTDSPGKDPVKEPGKKRFYSEKIWTNKAGRILRLEVEMGVSEPEGITLREITIYKCDLKIKIEAPIK